MNTAELTNGEHILVVRTDHLITRVTFAIALADHFYSSGEDFPVKLTKKESEKILRKGIYFHGRHGMYAYGYFEAAYEEGERYNKVYDAAELWVRKAFPWLDHDVD